MFLMFTIYLAVPYTGDPSLEYNDLGHYGGDLRLWTNWLAFDGEAAVNIASLCLWNVAKFPSFRHSYFLLLRISDWERAVCVVPRPSLVNRMLRPANSADTG